MLAPRDRGDPEPPDPALGVLRRRGRDPRRSRSSASSSSGRSRCSPRKPGAAGRSPGGSSASCSRPGCASSPARSRSPSSPSSGSARSSARTTAGVNFTPTFVYVFFWVGMPIVVGGVRERLARTSTRGARPPRASAGSRTGSASATRRRSSTRPAWGRWPAAFLLLLVRRDGALVHRPVEPAGARAGDRHLQRDHLVRGGALRLEGVVRERRRLRGRLPAPLADQPVRPAGGRPPLRARPVLRPLDQGHDAGDDRRSSR